MGRPIGTNNVMRTPEEKEKLVLEYFDSKVGYRRFAESKDIHPSIFPNGLNYIVRVVLKD